MSRPDTTPQQPGADGLDERAREIMAANPRTSARKIAALLKSKGIVRPIEWVYRNRNG